MRNEEVRGKEEELRLKKREEAVVSGFRGWFWKFGVEGEEGRAAVEEEQWGEWD